MVDPHLDSDDHELMLANELKALDICVEVLKLINASSVVMSIGVVAYVATVFGKSGFNVISISSISLFMGAAVSSFVSMCYLIWPTWHDEIDLSDVKIRYSFFLSGVLFFVGVLALFVFLYSI